MDVQVVKVDLIVGNPWQTRQGLDPEYVQELAQDIQRNGLLQPPVGRWADGHIQLAFGHNRVAAVRHLGWAEMTLFVADYSDEEMALKAWSENAARKNLTPIEEATAIQRDMTAFGWTQEEAGDKLGLARSTVANKLRLLKLPDSVQAAVAEGRVSERQASALLPLMEIPAEARQFADAHMDSYLLKPKDLIKGFGEGKVSSSDEVRAAVERISEKATVSLARCKFINHHFEGIPGIAFLAAECANCIWRAKGKETDLCRRPDCYEGKNRTWTALQGAAASKACGLEVLPPETNYQDFENFYEHNPDEMTAAKNIFAEGCKNLRIQPGLVGYRPNGVEGYHLVCLHGAEHKCTCKARELKRIHKNDPVAAQAIENEKVVAELKTAVQALVAAELMSGNVNAWRAYADSVFYNGDDHKFAKTASTEALAARLVRSLVDQWVTWQNKKNPIEAKAQLEEGLAKAGLKNPWTEYETPAQQAWGKFLRIRGWINRLPGELPRREAVEGNIANLYVLLDSDGFDEAQNCAVRASIRMLEQVAPDVSMLKPADFAPVQYLVERMVDDPGFLRELEKANEWALRFALAFIPADQTEKIDLVRKKIPKQRKTLIEVFAEEDQ